MTLIELYWEGKEEALKAAKVNKQHRLKPILSLSRGISKNMLIHSDNLIALKALLPLFRSKIRCCYLDPPYNTGNKFAHYSDKWSHSQWCSMMLPRLILIRQLLADDASLWISIDDHEIAQLKSICNEVFGEDNFVSNIIWQKKRSANDSRYIATLHEFILVYAKNKSNLKIHNLPASNFWSNKEVGDNAEGTREFKALSKVLDFKQHFATVKPERLISRILSIASDKGDLILDAFLGSGTTAAVAHKMDRNFIGIEAGEQMNSIIIPRLNHINADYNIVKID